MIESHHPARNTLLSRVKQHGLSFIIPLLFCAGIATRIMAAWRYRHITNLDAGVVALMAKHIAEGTNLPVFFYGQAHMGSLEALFSGLFCFLMGTSGFAVNLGTAFVACGLLPVVYFWAKDASGRFAGAIALSLCIIGPGGFFHYNGSPRGGYAAALTFGAFLMMYATRMAVHLQQNHPQRHRDYFILGIAAGLAWWSSQLTTAAILAAALLLLLALRHNAFTWKLTTGLAGFILGSLPLWIYNLVHNWETFQLGGSFQPRHFSRAVRWFFTERFPSLFISPTLAPAHQFLLTALYLALLPTGAFLLYKAFKQRNAPLFWALSSLFLFTLLFTTLYATSHFAVLNTPRYALPMVAPVTVAFALLITALPNTFSRRIGLIPVAYILTLQVPTLVNRTHEQQQAHQEASIQTFGEKATTEGIEILYAHVAFRSWNFLLNESIAFVDLDREFYRPNALRAEEAYSIGILQNLGGIKAFAQRVNATYREIRAGGFSAQYDFQFPQTPLTRLDPERIHSIRSPQRDDLKHDFLSGTLFPAFRQHVGNTQTSLHISFHEPTQIAGLDLWPETLQSLPGELAITARLADQSQIDLLEPSTLSQYFQSGPRLFWGNPGFRLQVRVPVNEVTDLYLHLRNLGDPREVGLLHLDLLTPAQEISQDLLQDLSQDFSQDFFQEELPAFAEVPSLMDQLKSLNITHLYTDRHAANQIHLKSNGTILTNLRPDLYPVAASITGNNPTLSPHSGLLSPASHASLVRTNLQHWDIAFNERAFPPWVLFTTPAETELTGLTWTGVHLLRNDPAYGKKRWEQGDLATGSKLHPYLPHPDAPQSPLDLRFRNGIKLLGFDLLEQTPNALTLRYHWKVPPDIHTQHFAVFVHFYRERIVFQDDHILLTDIPLLYVESPPDHQEYAIQRSLHLPHDLPPGPVNVRLGLYDRRTQHRIPVRSTLPRRKHAVELPLTLQHPASFVPSQP